MSPADYQAKRKALGYTQAGLAATLGVSRETIVRRESGDPRNPKVAHYQTFTGD
jgi:DNA-binding XRE family transcriptional regulator